MGSFATWTFQINLKNSVMFNILALLFLSCTEAGHKLETVGVCERRQIELFAAGGLKDSEGLVKSSLAT